MSGNRCARLRRTMGQTLSEPVTAKQSSSVQNSFYKVGASSMQGWRITMEDCHAHLLSLPEDPNACYFAVYDGHGGASVAEHAGNHLHKYIVQREEYKQGRFSEAMKQAFLEFDGAMMKDEKMRDELAGTTAITILIKNNQIYCANVGDSRAVACIAGHPEPLSSDHKPNNPDEATRINKAGGWVEYNRVNGNLALSRALGDFIFKQNGALQPHEQIVIAVPDVVMQNITPEYEFIILACDGIWDVMTNEEAVEFVRRRIAMGHEPESICEDLMTRCLAPDCQMGGLGCDNMTVILVCFLHGRNYSDLSTKVKATLLPSVNPCISTTSSVNGEYGEETGCEIEEEESSDNIKNIASSSDQASERDSSDEITLQDVVHQPRINTEAGNTHEQVVVTVEEKEEGNNEAPNSHSTREPLSN